MGIERMAAISSEDIVLNVILVSSEDKYKLQVYDEEYVTVPENRYNQCGEGYTYDKANDVFISPKPYPSWTLDASFDWQPPTAMPVDDKMYSWNEDTQAWDEVVPE